MQNKIVIETVHNDDGFTYHRFREKESSRILGEIIVHEHNDIYEISAHDNILKAEIMRRTSVTTKTAMHSHLEEAIMRTTAACIHYI